MESEPAVLRLQRVNRRHEFRSFDCREGRVLRCDKALILAKNVLYREKSDENDRLPPKQRSPSGSIIFRGRSQGPAKRA